MAIDITVWQTLVGLGTVATYLWSVRGRHVAPMMVASFVTWAYLSLQAEITTGYGSGATTSAYPGLQYLFGFLALAAAITLAAYVFDLWQPETDEEREGDIAETDLDAEDATYRDGPRTPLRSDTQ